MKTNKERINRGVMHKIKKPKKYVVKKTKNKLMATKKMRLTMPPRLASNRSPRKSIKKRHKLSSPGISLLENHDSAASETDDEMQNKFFTSRSRAAATVMINNAIKLSTKNGGISITQKEGGFEKKNIGRSIEKKLEADVSAASFLQSPLLSRFEGTKQLSPLRRPKPTRFPGTPSPKRSNGALTSFNVRESPKRALSRQSLLKSLNPVILNGRTNNLPENVESTLEPLYNGKVDKQTVKNNSKFVSLDQINLSPIAMYEEESKDLDLAFDVSNSLHPEQDKILSTLISENESPIKSAGSLRRSPRKKDFKSSPQKCPVKNVSKESFTESNSLKLDKIKNVKYFPVFDPKRRNRVLPSIQTRGKKSNGLQPKKLLMKRSDKSQLIIDAGQKQFGAITCKTCGLLYEIGDPEDEAYHLNSHEGFLNCLNFSGWKVENQITNLDNIGGRIIKISSSDPAYCWRKVKQVLKFVDSDLGFSENGIRSIENTTAFLYIIGKKIVGCLIAENIIKAYKVIQQHDDEESETLICCSDVPQNVVCGISRIWVLASQRRKGIAAKLVDAMRANYFSYHFLNLDKFAFSDPTQLGMKFAEKYCKIPDFLVYRRED